MKILPVTHIEQAKAAIKIDFAQSTTAQAEAQVGLAMHRLLEWAPLGVDAHAHCAAHSAAVAREFTLSDSQTVQAAALAQRILQGAGAWAWQAEHIDWHGNEVALAFDGQGLRLDRLVRRSASAEWWVLDYKSAAQPLAQTKLRQQLQRYRQAVQAQYPGQPVRAAFLSGQGGLEALD